jgi:hypothetical protein
MVVELYESKIYVKFLLLTIMKLTEEQNEEN